MRGHRSDAEVNELIRLARVYCELRAHAETARAEGRLSEENASHTQRSLFDLDERLRLLRSNSEVDRQRARRVSNVLVVKFGRRTADAK